MMDQKGSLVDTTIRIFPSDKLLTFLEHENFKGNIPSNVRKLLKGDYDRHTAENDFNTKQINLNLSKSDIELLSKISNKLKINQVDQSSGENIKKKIKIDKTETNKTQGNNIKLPNAIQNECLEKIKDKNLGQQFEGPYLTVFDIDWVFLYINEQRRCNKDIPYLHDLLEGCKIELPNNEIIKRNPILEARCVKLRAQQEAREYRKMTKGVDNVRMRFPEDSISYQLKQLNRQLIAIGQFIISIFAGFLFGFKGIEWMIGNLDFGFRLLLGVMCALIIALAEIYFLAKKLNEELTVPETTQLGGPPRFVDESLNEYRNKKPVLKAHQD